MNRKVRKKPVRRTHRNSVPRNKPKINWAGLFYTFVFTVLFSLAITYVLNTPDLNINKDNISIKGVHLSDYNEISRITDSADGRNILLFRKTPIIRAIKKIPEVDNVKIGRHFPNTIWVRVIEKKPVASIKTNDGYAMVNAAGIPFHFADSPAENKPVIIAAGCDNVELGKVSNEASLQYALRALYNLKSEGIDCKTIRVDQKAVMCLNMSSGLLVILGQPDDLPSKIRQLRRALEDEPSLGRDMKYINVTCPNAMSAMPKVEAAVNWRVQR